MGGEESVDPAMAPTAAEHNVREGEKAPTEQRKATAELSGKTRAAASVDVNVTFDAVLTADKGLQQRVVLLDKVLIVGLLDEAVDARPVLERLQHLGGVRRQVVLHAGHLEAVEGGASGHGVGAGCEGRLRQPVQVEVDAPPKRMLGPPSVMRHFDGNTRTRVSCFLSLSLFLSLIAYYFSQPS